MDILDYVRSNYDIFIEEEQIALLEGLRDGTPLKELLKKGESNIKMYIDTSYNINISDSDIKEIMILYLPIMKAGATIFELDSSSPDFINGMTRELTPIMVEMEDVIFTTINKCYDEKLRILPMLAVGNRVDKLEKQEDPAYMQKFINKNLSFHAEYQGNHCSPIRAVFKFYGNEKGKRILVVKAGTGTGKTTNIPIITARIGISKKELTGNRSINIVCTQPRRYNVTEGGKSSRKFILSDKILYNIVTNGDEYKLSQMFFDRNDLLQTEPKRKEIEHMVSWLVGGRGVTSSSGAKGRKLLFETEELFLVRLQNAPDKMEFIRQFSHIFIDEVHERTIMVDCILSLLRKYWLQARKESPADPDFPFIIIMSATLDPMKYLRFFEVDLEEDFDQLSPLSSEELRENFHESIIKVAGTSYAVAKHFLESAETKRLMSKLPDYLSLDYHKVAAELALAIHNSYPGDLITQEDEPTVKLLCSNFNQQDVEEHDKLGGAKNILIFVPTQEDTMKIASMISAPNLEVYTWYRGSSTPKETLESDENKDIRKIIVATNIAETGITLKRLKYVIDIGLLNEVIFDPILNSSEAQILIAPQNSLIQRHGRVGRTGHGVVFCLYKEEEFKKFPIDRQPEIMISSFAVPLQQLALEHEMGSDKPFDVLSDIELIDLPSPDAVFSAYNELFRTGMMDMKMRLTLAGRFCAGIGSLDPKLRKFLWISPFYQCFDAAVSIIALLKIGVLSDFASSVAKVAQDHPFIYKLGSDIINAYFVYNVIREEITPKYNLADDPDKPWIRTKKFDFKKKSIGDLEMGITYEGLKSSFEEILQEEESIKERAYSIGIPSWDSKSDLKNYYLRISHAFSEAFSSNLANFNPELRGWVPEVLPEQPSSLVTYIKSSPKIISNAEYSFVNDKKSARVVETYYPPRLVYYSLMNHMGSLSFDVVSPYYE